MFTKFLTNICWVNEQTMWNRLKEDLGSRHTTSNKHFLNILFINQRQGLLSPRLECHGTIITHCSFKLLSSSTFPASASRVTGTISKPHHFRLISFLFFGETGTHFVARAGFERLVSRNTPAAASKSAGITGTHDSTWLGKYFFFFFRRSLALSPRLECSGGSRLTVSSAFGVHAILLPGKYLLIVLETKKNVFHQLPSVLPSPCQDFPSCLRTCSPISSYSCNNRTRSLAGPEVR